jgi:hypothetical protein
MGFRNFRVDVSHGSNEGVSVTEEHHRIEITRLLIYRPRTSSSSGLGKSIVAEYVKLEPVVVQVNPVMLAAHAPHPTAGKLFIDFILSKQGKLCCKVFVASRHTDVKPTPSRLIEGFKRVVLYSEDDRTLVESSKLYKKILGYNSGSPAPRRD